MENFSAGDAVRLKNVESPIMTIHKILNDTGYTPKPKFAICRWFVNSELKEATFPLATLELYQESK
jgi:uncharacterized protein YodC (DUF2158 family)